MATSPSDIKSSYPLPAYNYRVTILFGSTLAIPKVADVAANADLGTVISCSEVSGLNMEIETITYKHGFSFLTGMDIIPGQKKEVQLTIKKGVTKNSRYFSDWINLVYPVIAGLPVSLVQKRDVLIDLCDENGDAVVRWVITKAMPIKLEAPTFDATTNDVAFEQLHLVASQIRVDYLNSSSIISAFKNG
ncbi:MAG: phage tail protein [Bacteroidota bacterium]